MLYCPKCQKTYEDAVQRFCLNDGRRLLRETANDRSSSGVFTTILNRKIETETDKFASAPRFTKTKIRPFVTSDFHPPFDSEIFEIGAKAKPEVEIVEPLIELSPEIEIANQISAKIAFEPEIEAETIATETTPRFIAPWEIPKSQALLGDRKTNPAGRKALTWENPSALIDQTVKGRYLIVAQTGADESGITYLAEDKIVPNKKVVVRILMDEDTIDSFASKVYAEERVSLSHVNHPNIASVIDSGELSEGKPFIITEFIEGKSIEELLQNDERFDVQRVARIVRQASYALSEVHQSGVLHRNLKPENIVLAINEKGAEQVKLTNFGASKDKLNETNLPYKSPEQVGGKLANFASDEYSLAVIAYRMLTNHLPFSAVSVGKLLKAQREGLKIEASDLRPDLPATANKILEKALAFNPSDRYPKSRDFGDAFFNAVFGNAGLKPDESSESKTDETPIPMPSSLLVSNSEPEITEDAKATTTEKSVEQMRVSENPSDAKAGRALLAVLGAAILILGIWVVWSYFLNRANEAKSPVQNPAETANISNRTTNPPVNAANKIELSDNLEPAPLPRSITPPPNTNYFQNNRENLKDEAAKNFLGFSLYYPKDWKLNEISGGNAGTKTRGTFLDISKNASSGTPLEQMIVSYYDSNGTFKTDTENFTKQVIETNETLSKIIPNYEMVSEGEKTINNGWRAYEVKFQGTGKTPAGEKITLWGKRLFVPAAIRGLKNGYMITMLATSLSKDVTGVEDVGTKGELSNILSTFEPNQTF